MRALVTGAAKRVGRAIALELAQHGFDVCIHYGNSKDEAEGVAHEARALGVDAWTVSADLSDVAGPEHVVRAVQERWDTLDVLVNNASAFEPVPFADITPEVWEQMLGVNLRAPFLLSQGLLPQLQASGAGLVVQLCDIGAERPVNGYAHYSVSKAGLLMLVKAMSVELAPAVRTVGVSPGQVAWPPDYGPEKRAQLTRRIPMRTVGTPEDIARLVRFLALEAPYVNGEIIAVDGGLQNRY